MIIESPAALRLMASLAELGADGGGREYLVHKAGVGTTTFYRLIGRLIESGLVVAKGGRYALAFDNPYCLQFKLWNDMERLYRLAPEDRDTVLGLINHVRIRAGDKLRALWLVGSGARSELSPKSDLDFLYVTSGEVLSLDETGQRRQLSIVQMSEDEFRQSYQRADSFVVSAIKEGIVLIDRDFVREFYVSPPTIQIRAERARESESATSQNRSRLLAELARDDMDQAHASLSAQAIHIGRLMLRTFGELPPNRKQLVEVSRIYFGPALAELLRSAMTAPPDNKTEVIALSRRLAELHDRFQNQAAHLQRFAKIPSSSGPAMERLAGEVLAELAPGAPGEPSDIRIDIVRCTTDGTILLVECKAFKGKPSIASVDAALRQLNEAATRANVSTECILLLNSHLDLPPSERPSLSQELDLVELASSLSTSGQAPPSVLTGLDLLCAHNRLHLEEVAPGTVLSDLLRSGAVRTKR